MDKTPKYIKMCREAREIQERLPLFSKRMHSFFWADGKIGGWVEVVNTRTKKYIWLPRQDQLQEIYLDFLKKQLDHDEVIYMPGFVIFTTAELKMLGLAWNRDYTPLESYEQLWLLLIMIQVFNKRWDDDKEKWIKCRENWWYVSKEFLKEAEEKIDKEEKENAKSN